MLIGGTDNGGSHKREQTNSQNHAPDTHAGNPCSIIPKSWTEGPPSGQLEPRLEALRPALEKSGPAHIQLDQLPCLTCQRTRAP